MCSNSKHLFLGGVYIACCLAALNQTWTNVDFATLKLTKVHGIINTVQWNLSVTTTSLIKFITCDWPALCAGLLCCNFFGQPGSVSKFSPFLWVKLWVGWVGRGYTEISRYFPASWINWVTLVTNIKLFCIHWDFRSHLNHQKCLYGMIYLRLKALFCVQYTIPPPAAM